MSNRNILVIGGAGYVGSHVVTALLNHDCEVTVVDSLVTGHELALDRAEDISGKPLKFIHKDVRDTSFPAGTTFDAVVHLAGLKSVPESFTQPARYYEQNLEATLAVLRLARECHIGRIVFSSSAAVYTRSGDKTLHERSPVGTKVSPYAHTKLMSEQMLSDEAMAREHLTTVSLRYFNPIGAHISGLIGEDNQAEAGNLMTHMLRVASGAQPHLVIYGDGSAVRDFIDIEDLARAHLAALLVDDGDSHIFNVGTGAGTTVLGLLKAFTSATGIPIPCVFEEPRVGDAERSVADVRKASETLRWRAMVSIQKSCYDSYRWHTKNPEGYGHG